MTVVWILEDPEGRRQAFLSRSAAVNNAAYAVGLGRAPKVYRVEGKERKVTLKGLSDG